MENPEGNHDPLANSGLEDKIEQGEDENPSHNAGPANLAVRGELEERLLHDLNLKMCRVMIKVDDFQGKKIATY